MIRLTHQAHDDGSVRTPRLIPIEDGRFETIMVAGRAIEDLLERHARERAVERERFEMLDRVEARAQARRQDHLDRSARTLHEADRRWRAKVEALRLRAAPPSVPMCVPQPPPVVREPSPERTGGWWDDPVAAEVIDFVDAAPLATEEEVRRARVRVARSLHPDVPGNDVYAPLLATINQLLDDALDRLRAGIPDEVPDLRR